MSDQIPPKTATPDEIRSAMAHLFRDMADRVEELPDAYFSGAADPLVRQGVMVLREIVAPLSNVAAGLSLGARSHYPAVLGETGRTILRSGIDHLAHAPLLNHLRDCAGHPTEGTHHDHTHGGTDAVDPGGSATGEPLD